VTQLCGDDEGPGYSHVKKVNRMSTQLQALVHDLPCQRISGKLLGTVMASVLAPRPPLGSVRDSTDQPSDSSNSLEHVEKVMPKEKELSHMSVNCPVLLNQSWLILSIPVLFTKPALTSLPSLLNRELIRVRIDMNE